MTVARPVSAAARAAIEVPQARDAIIAFATISHPNLIDPIRVVSDVIDYVVEGDLFIGIVFEVKLLNDTDAAPVTELRVPNIDRRIGVALKSLTQRAQVRLDVRSSADFDLSVDPRVAVGDVAPIYSFRHFDLIDVDCNAEALSGRLILRDFAQEPWPGVFATQTALPGLFR